MENPREIVEPGQDVRVKILEIDSERMAVAVGQARGGAAGAHQVGRRRRCRGRAGVPEEIGDVPDLGLSEDVFAGLQVSGADDLRAALSSVQPPAA